MAPTLVREPFHHDGWVYEEKVDGRVEGWRGTSRPVSSPRRIERRARISRTPLSCRLRGEGYVTYRTGRVFKRGHTKLGTR